MNEKTLKSAELTAITQHLIAVLKILRSSFSEAEFTAAFYETGILELIDKKQVVENDYTEDFEFNSENVKKIFDSNKIGREGSLLIDNGLIIRYNRIPCSNIYSLYLEATNEPLGTYNTKSGIYTS